MKRKSLLWVFILLIIIITTIILIHNNEDEQDSFIAIKSEQDLRSYYKFLNNDIRDNIPLLLATIPISNLTTHQYNSSRISGTVYDTSDSVKLDIMAKTLNEIHWPTNSFNKTQNDYSTTNIQVENVDEADVTKTDGNFIYSISGNYVVITDVSDIENINIVAKYEMTMNAIPQDLMLYKDRLVVIGATSERNRSDYQYSYYYYYYKYSTVVNILNLSNIKEPRLEKSYKLDQAYYTSRCIDGNFYLISTGKINTDIKNDDRVAIPYYEDYVNKEIDYNNIMYMKSNKTNDLTLIAYTDLKDSTIDVRVNSYFMNIQEAYISTDNIYLSMKKKKVEKELITLKNLFNPKGIIGVYFDITNYNSYFPYEYKTEIYKFAIDKQNINFIAKTSTDGSIINQFSFDEYNDMLRVAIYDDGGSRVVVFNSNLEELGRTENLAKGEKMYSSRFIGERAYLVTYKVVDPLFVIDLSNPTKPTMVGYLKIPGYSTYLHPYDENHIIGIGMQTESDILRDNFGRVTSTNSLITGMKMALFDVTDVSNPREISNVVIGDSRTTSSILSNHKALLFSKEKNIIAIPVKNYSDNFKITYYDDNISNIISSYNSKQDYISEGYVVYNISIDEGIKEKGVINHDLFSQQQNIWNLSYSYRTSILRGLYINDNLYTVSENMLKVNKISDLSLIKELYFE